MVEVLLPMVTDVDEEAPIEIALGVSILMPASPVMLVPLNVRDAKAIDAPVAKAVIIAGTTNAMSCRFRLCGELCMPPCGVWVNHN
jgi:hypothetical protein